MNRSSPFRKLKFYFIWRLRFKFRFQVLLLILCFLLESFNWFWVSLKMKEERMWVCNLITVESLIGERKLIAPFDSICFRDGSQANQKLITTRLFYQVLPYPMFLRTLMKDFSTTFINKIPLWYIQEQNKLTKKYMQKYS